MTDSEKEKASNHLDSDNTNHMEEWKQARDVVKSYDEHLHDLRKYGFSFLTALLAAGAILTPAITELKTGVYQLQPRDWPRPLHRRIIVIGDTP